MYYFSLFFWHMNWCMLLQLYNKIICSFFQWRYTQNWGLLWKTYRLGKEEGHYKKLTSSPNFNTSLASAIIISFVLSTTLGSGGQQQTIGAFANGSPSCKHNWQPYLPLNCFMHVITNCTENHIFFFQTSWKDGLSKKSSWYMIFLVLLGRMISLFPTNMILYLLGGKWKMIFLKKYTEKWYFLQVFWKDGLFKRDCAGTWSFLYYLERLYFFLKNMIGRKVKSDLFQEIHGNMKFSVYLYGCYKRGSAPLRQKSQRSSYPAKIHQKVIDVLDWHSRKGFSSSL